MAKFTQKDTNKFFAGILLATLAGVLGSFFIGSFFILIQILNYSYWTILFIFFDSGLGLLIIMIWMNKRIKI